MSNLVSILIPAYKYQFFELSLMSAIKQTYKNIEIIICDDSNEDYIKTITEKKIIKYPQVKISYYKNEKNIIDAGESNYIKCFGLSSGEYIKFLNDDDIILENCVEEMVKLFEKYGNTITLITSKRGLIDENGNTIKDSNFNLPPSIVDDNLTYSFIKGKDIINYTLSNLINQIGEPSTFMFRKKNLENIKPNIFSILGIYIRGNIDITMSINLLHSGNLIYINKELSYFRISPLQAQINPSFLYIFYIHCFYVSNLSRKLGFLSNDNDLIMGLKKISSFYENLILKESNLKCIIELRAKNNLNNKIPIVIKFLIKKILQIEKTSILSKINLNDLKIKFFLINNQIKNKQLNINNMKICSVCCNNIDSFKPLDLYYENKLLEYGFKFKLDMFETMNSKEYLCPLCYSSDRDRIYALYLLSFLSEMVLFEKYNIFNLSKVKFVDYLYKIKFFRRFFKVNINRVSNVLKIEKKLKLIDFAPSSPLSVFIKQLDNFHYRTADLFMKNVDDKIDICNMTYESNSFDIFICSHVLEHVTDDNKAFSELFRILKPDGWGILMAPICLSIDNDIEGIDNGTKEERWKYYGQDDHVRLYSKDGFITKIKKHGFLVKELTSDFFGTDTFRIFGININSILYVVYKSEKIWDKMNEVSYN